MLQTNSCIIRLRNIVSQFWKWQAHQIWLFLFPSSRAAFHEFCYIPGATSTPLNCPACFCLVLSINSWNCWTVTLCAFAIKSTPSSDCRNLTSSASSMIICVLGFSCVLVCVPNLGLEWGDVWLRSGDACEDSLSRINVAFHLTSSKLHHKYMQNIAVSPAKLLYRSPPPLIWLANSNWQWIRLLPNWKPIRLLGIILSCDMAWQIFTKKNDLRKLSSIFILS